jgi:L-fuculose-phosphate aldolase
VAAGRALAEQIVDAGLRLVAGGLTDGTTGNISARADTGFLVTPTSRDYRGLRSRDLVYVDLVSDDVRGRWNPSSEWRLHAEIYRARSNVHGIVHHHGTWSSAVASVGCSIPVFLDEAADLGAVTTAPYAPSASLELARVAAERICAGPNAVLLANHGAVAVGASVAEALRRALQVERLAKMFVVTELLGGAQPLGEEAIAKSRAFFAEYRAAQHDRSPF